jgi:hypothetical protein
MAIERHIPASADVMAITKWSISDSETPYGQKIKTVEKTVSLSIPGIASPGGAG